MLRIESYITPLILSYVDKYIKNLKPEDSQVSLWGGDAVFNNLDLRLDVLEQELRLPFSFVNGHIHELRIHVPWTKLTSEPIVITINTIECILKLKGGDTASSETSSQGGTGSKAQDVRRRQRRQDLEVPTSYVQGLINRIINNVCIVCNNVILKYVEDDIVLSINVKTLEFRSVDGNWTPAFIDLTAEDLILRNLATLTDLTVCLDKRNASGKIENYQEPLLYRCSLSCRVVRQFESINSIQPLCTRYDVFCPQLHFSLSDMQLPMFLRLLELSLALYYGELGTYTEPEQTICVPQGEDQENALNEDFANDNASWSSWAWSLGSALLPVYWEDEENAMSSHRYRLNKTLHMGLYVETATWTFKLTESVQESGYFGPTKMRFTPFMRIEHQGSFMTIVIRGLEAVNVQLGISSLTVDPVGMCICGIADIQEGDISSGEGHTVKAKGVTSFINVGQEGQEYLSQSLFDPQVLMEAQELWDYSYTWEKHAKDTTEAVLLARTGAMAMDYFYYMEIPQDMNSEQLSEISVDLEYSNMSERAICRVVFGASEISLSSGLYHRVEAVSHALNQHDYPPYSSPPNYAFKGSRKSAPKIAKEESSQNPNLTSDILSDILQVSEKFAFILKKLEPPDNISVPSEEEVALLESNTPIRSYVVTVIEPTLVLHAAQHGQINMKTIFSAKRRKRNQKASAELCMARVLPVPSIRVKLSRFDTEWTKPMYAKRLVSAACMLRPASQTMLHNCHSHLTFTAHNVCIGLQYQNNIVPLLQGFSPSLYYKSLLLPAYWKLSHQPHNEYFFHADTLNVEFSAPQLMLCYQLLRSWQEVQPQPERLHQDTLVEDSLSVRRLPVIAVKVGHVEAKSCDTLSLNGNMATVGSLSVGLHRPQGDLLCLLLSGPEDNTGLEVLLPETLSASDKLIKIVVQFPKDNRNESVPSVLTVGMKKIAVLFDPQLMQWLRYSPRKIDSDILTEMVFLKKISEVRGIVKPQRKPSESESEVTKVESSTATLSEAKTGSRGILFSTQESAVEEPPKSWKEKFIEWYPILSRLLIHVDLDTATIFLSSSPLSIASESGLVNAVHRTYLTRSERILGDTLVLCLPHLVLHNAAQKQNLLQNVYDVPVMLPSDLWATGRDKLPWSLNLGGFSVYSLHGTGNHVKLQVLKPVNTTATLAITTKYQGPSLNQLGIVIHTDMSPLDFCGSRCQVVGHVTILENLLNLASLFVKPPKEYPGGSTSSTPAPQPLEASSEPTTLPPFHQSTSPPLQSQFQPSHNQTPPKQLNHSSSDPNTLLVTEVEEIEEERVQVVSEADVQSSSGPVVTAWVQWTVARVSASLYANDGGESRKLRAELEDLTTALDFHQVYSKVKVKVTSVSILHFTKRNNSWVAGEHEGVVMTCGDQLTHDLKVINPLNGTVDPHYHCGRSNNTPTEQPKPHGFISLTLTTALCKNIHSCWNTLIKKLLNEERNMPNDKTADHYLSEVDIRIQPFDCVCFPASLHIFATVYEPWLQLQIPKNLMHTGRAVSKTPLGMQLNNHTLPLVYLHAETIRLFLPSRDTSSEDLSVQNMFLIQLDSTMITPQVDNPLSRIMIRSDIFHMAERARILGVPGSEVEDRQYQIDLSGFSISTGSWYDLVHVKGGRPRSSSGERLRVMGENPALEWNNYDPTQDNKNTDIILHPFIARFDSRIIAAPAIVYRGSEDANENLSNVLVAGHSLEINATSDIDLHISLPQFILLQEIIEDTTRLISQMVASGKKGRAAHPPRDIQDSGVDCDISSVELTKVMGSQKTSSAASSWSFVPIELLITGGKITASVFDRGYLEEGQKLSVKGWQRSKLEQRAKKRERELITEAASTESEPSPKRLPQFRQRLSLRGTEGDSHSEKEVEDGYEGSEEGSVCEGGGVSSMQLRVMPLLFVVVSQPHAFLSCQPLKQKLDISCFDFILRSVPKGFSVKATEAKRLPTPEDYTSSWLETRPGDPHPKTGIPPALLVISALDFLHKPARINVEVGRPIRLYLSESRWQQVVHVASCLSKVMPSMTASSEPDRCSSDEASKHEGPKASSPEVLRQSLTNFDSISIATNQVVVNCEILKPNKYKSEAHSSVSGFRFCVSTARKRSTQPLDNKLDSISEILVSAEVQDLQLKTIYHSQKLQPFLRPWTVSGELKLLWLQWSSQPYIEVKIDTETLTADLGPENLFCFMDIEQHISGFLGKRETNSSTKGGSEKAEKEERHHDILYQDDLRAGIFQYVSLALEDPKPYQVVFDKMAGTMVWCYPEPRTLTRVDIYPVPFVAASEYSTLADAQDKDQVMCALQYFDSLRDTFITYRQFELSESKFCQLDLPSFYEKQHIAVSSMWRVVIDYCEEESDSGDGRIVVSPGALAACMRVDSMFSVDLLPRMQAVVTLGQAQITLLNHLSLTGKKLPKELKSYAMDKLAPEEQPFLTCTLENTFIRQYVWSAAVHVQVGGSLRVDVLSYTFLTNSCLLEPTFIEARLVTQNADGPDKPNCIDSLVTVKPMFIHINQSLIHTLNVAHESWLQVSSIVADVANGPNLTLVKKSPVIFMTNYLICNDTLETIRFGQVGTDENILLSSRSLHLYCWRSHKLPPKLQVCVEGGKWKWCDPFMLETEGSQVRTIHHESHHIHFLVILETLSPTQKLITFSGLLSIANYLSEHLEFRVMEMSKEKESPKHTITHMLHSETVAPSYVGEAHGIRVRLMGNQTVWSGEIPLSLERTKDSLLVKIPLKVKGESILSWCRVLRQRVGSVWRLLVIFSPQYMVRSHLPRPLILHITTPSTQISNQMIVKGRGNIHTLHCDNSVSHHLTFQLNPELEVSSPPIPLSRGMADQMRLSQSQDSVDISQYLQQLFDGPEDRWPYIDTSDFMGDVLFADQPKIDLQVGFSSLSPYCSTLVVDIRPWALVVNHTGIEILLQEVESPNSWFVPPGAVFAPPKFDGLFTIGLVDKEEHFHTASLQFSKEDRWYSLKFEGQIPREGSINLRIPTHDKVCFITVLSKYEENIQIMHLVPTYSIANNTLEEMTVRSMYVYSGEIKVQLPISLPTMQLCSKSSNSEMRESAILFWHILKDPGSSSSDEEICCIQIGQNGYHGHPVIIRDGLADQRMTFTLPSKESGPILNRSFLITAHKHFGQVKMIVQVDPSPQMILHNNTKALLILGQSSLKEEGIMEEELDMFAAMPSVPPSKAVHYTFPYISQKFPNILANGAAYPRLHFSQPDILNNAETEEVLWSQGVDIQQHYDQFVSIPGHGDVKVRIEHVGQTTHVFIDPVSRVEVSAKDIRSRIAAEPSKGRVATSTNRGRAIKEKEGMLPEGDPLLAHKANIDFDTASLKESSTEEGNPPKSPVLPQTPKEAKSTTVLYCSFFCTQVVLVLKDDVSDQENISEIMRITLDNFIVSARPKIDLSEKLRALDYRVKERIEVFIFLGDAQIDNQLFVLGKYDFPVILIRQNPEASPKFSTFDPIERAIQISHNNALFTLSLILERAPVGMCMYSVHIKLKPICLYAEDAIFYSFMDILSSFLPVSKHKPSSLRERETEDEEEEKLPVVMKMPQEVLVKSHAMTWPIHVTQLTIEPISLLLSVHASIKLYVALDQTPLNFGKYDRLEIRTTSYSLGHNLAMHYLSGALIRAGWVVGSLDLLGNPGGFARMVGSGVRDFVQLPYEGILLGPWAFIAGITHGSMSLVKHLTAGTVVSLTNLANSVARNMERLSLDADHAARSEAGRRYQSSGLAHGLMQGLSAFGISLLGAVGGLVHQPMQAIMNEGVTASTVVGGVGKGLVGIVTKPIGGAADLIVHTGQGLLQGAGWHQEQVAKFPPMVEPHNMEVNAPLKLVWKLVAALPQECRAVLAAVDATHLTTAGTYTPVTILLTPQVLFILGIEEDAQQHALPLHEVTWRAHANDPTLIYIEKVQPEPKPQNPDMEPVSGCPERVADYVRSTCSEGLEVGGIDSSAASSEEDEHVPGHFPRIRLYVSPRLRPALLSSINIAARASQGRGFIV
ncbi:intermembrane lipid transfer protein VPS13B isoform X1 [Palaemon carinicauda]|uniref:intermembrane lipid transfer protein VPS13B isoform X1 n=1 Tax=Palaemon carinicauda TaxID=392227 RepID=UPI0035B57CF2